MFKIFFLTLVYGAIGYGMYGISKFLIIFIRALFSRPQATETPVAINTPVIVDVFEDADYIPNPRDYYGLENPQNIQLAINNTDDMMSPYYIELYDDEY